MTVANPALVRCPWADSSNERLVAYHDTEWGVPQHDERALFELLALEAFQAGLSWSIVLAKREAFREAFDTFDVKRVAKYDAKRVAALVGNAAIVRNRAKIEATVGNAAAFLAVRKEEGSFDRYIWGFVGGSPIVRRPRRSSDVPSESAESEAMSRDLKARGFRFVGATICYAFMQAAGLVDDHLASCFRAQGPGPRRRVARR
jgi:DNA-3-methyladenine glycosylase I